MKIIKPIKLTDAILTSTNVHETAPDLYAEGTDYSKGDFAHIVNGLKLDVYESLDDSNIGNDPTTSDKWQYRSFVYPEYASGTTYGIGDIVSIVATHKRYESIQDANTGNDPATATTYWIEIGYTNPWVAFDEKIGSRVVRTGKIEYVITPGEIVEKIAFFNMEAADIEVSLEDPVEGVVFTQNIEVISISNVFDGYSYCFAPFIRTRNTVTLDIPPYPNAVITISINGGDDTETVGAGTIVFGPVSYIGATQYSPTIEIIDYSTKDADEYGTVTVVERAFSRRITVDMVLENSLLGYVLEDLETYRATAVAWVTTEANNDLQNPYLIYGFYKGYNTVAQYPLYSMQSIELESLI